MTAQLLTKNVQENSNKISRWVVQSLLAGVDQIKFAFVTRRNAKDLHKHLVLSTYGLQANMFANQINLNMGVW